MAEAVAPTDDDHRRSADDSSGDDRRSPPRSRSPRRAKGGFEIWPSIQFLTFGNPRSLSCCQEGFFRLPPPRSPCRGFALQSLRNEGIPQRLLPARPRPPGSASIAKSKAAGRSRIKTAHMRRPTRYASSRRVFSKKPAFVTAQFSGTQCVTSAFLVATKPGK